MHRASDALFERAKQPLYNCRGFGSSRFFAFSKRLNAQRPFNMWFHNYGPLHL